MYKHTRLFLQSILILILFVIIDVFTKSKTKQFSLNLLKDINEFFPNWLFNILTIFYSIIYYSIDIFIYIGLFYRRNKRESFNIFIVFCLF